MDKVGTIYEKNPDFALPLVKLIHKNLESLSYLGSKMLGNFAVWNKRQPQKMVKQTQTIRRQTADEFFECVWPFCGVGALMVKLKVWISNFVLAKYIYSM